MKTRRGFFAVLVALTVLAGPIAAAPAPTPEAIAIPQGRGTLKGVMYRPPGDGPFPAIVAMHGCSGLYNAARAVSTQYRDWARHLTRANFVVVFPDSYGSRGLGSQCAVRTRSVRPERERVNDANATRAWLQSQSFVQADRVSLLGWSNGGISVLWAARRHANAQPETEDFRSAVALYPGCKRLTNAAWSARIPTLVLVGGSDDWTSARACRQMIAGARGRSARAEIVVYRGAYHDFDHPNLPLRERVGVAFSADGSGRVHIGTDPAARADALKRVPQWLGR